MNKPSSRDRETSHSCDQIRVEVIYALPNDQQIVEIKIDSNSTVEQAIVQSKLLEKYPEIDLTKNKIGIFSRVCQLGDPLYDWDRIEIYRPLLIDPKEARKNRAKKNKA